MNKTKKTLLSILLCSSLIGVGTLVANGAGLLSAQPGDSADPLVTKSYVDKLVADLKSGTGGSTGGGSTGEGTITVSSNELKIETIKPGQQLVGKSGTEIVVRAGKAEIFSADADGVSDLTDGADLTNGKDVPKNHLLLVPRDGRGITAKDAAKNSVVVAVRGEYTIKNVPADK